MTTKVATGSYNVSVNGELGKIFILIGVLFVAAGIIFLLKGHIPWLGRLPGDIHVERDNFRFYFPLATSIVISILLTLILYFFRK